MQAVGEGCKTGIGGVGGNCCGVRAHFSSVQAGARCVHAVVHVCKVKGGGVCFAHKCENGGICCVERKRWGASVRLCTRGQRPPSPAGLCNLGGSVALLLTAMVHFFPSLFPSCPPSLCLCSICAIDRSVKSSPTCWLRTDLPWGTHGPTPFWSRASRAA